MNIIRLINDSLVIDYVKYRTVRINKRYRELKEKVNKLEQQRYDLELAMIEINKLISLSKQEIEKLEQEIVRDPGVK